MRGSKPLNVHFMAAGGSADAAEMTQMQRMQGRMPPPCNLCLPLLSLLSF
ncbi:MAG: hypothetical protein ABI970_12980 [Chloroflexota bacterium]